MDERKIVKMVQDASVIVGVRFTKTSFRVLLLMIACFKT